ncbi:MAG TPA: glycine zipper 2TM domain-containing protein [Gemmatimonadaceae bacterium]|nr:glycine zipper 2TM domain-containing protein [Gemmatimonadaceae bacterium]
MFVSRIDSRRLTAAILFAGAAVTACSDQKRNTSADSDLSRDLQLAGQMSAQPQPTFQDTALSPQSTPLKASAANKTPTPTRTARRERMTPAQPPLDATPQPRASAPIPTAARAPAAAPSKQIGAGTGVVMTSGSRVCTDSNRPGDKIVATVDSPVNGTNGAVIPSGSKIVLEVASVTPGDQAQILFRVRSVYVNDSSYSISGDVTPSTPLERVKVQNPDANADKKKVIGGAIAGAILGQMIGHNTKGTVIGAATGAAAGAVAAKATEKYESCLPAGASLHMTLAQAVMM